MPSATPPPGPLRDQGYENAREGAARAIGRRARRAGGMLSIVSNFRIILLFSKQGGTRTSSSTAAATQRRKQTYASAAGDLYHFLV